MSVAHVPPAEIHTIIFSVHQETFTVSKTIHEFALVPTIVVPLQETSPLDLITLKLTLHYFESYYAQTDPSFISADSQFLTLINANKYYIFQDDTSGYLDSI